MKAQSRADMAMPFDRADVRGRFHAKTAPEDDRLHFRQALARETPARDAHWSIDDRVTVLRADQGDDIAASASAAIWQHDGASETDALPRLAAALERLLARPETATMRRPDERQSATATWVVETREERPGGLTPARDPKSIDVPTRHSVARAIESKPAEPKSEIQQGVARAKSTAFPTSGATSEADLTTVRPQVPETQAAAGMTIAATTDLPLAAVVLEPSVAEPASSGEPQKPAPLEPAIVETAPEQSADLPQQRIEPAMMSGRWTSVWVDRSDLLTTPLASPTEPAASDANEDVVAFEPIVVRSPEPAPSRAALDGKTDPKITPAIVRDKVEVAPVKAFDETAPLSPTRPPVAAEPVAEIAASPRMPVVASDATKAEPWADPLPPVPTAAAEPAPTDIAIEAAPPAAEPDETDAAPAAEAEPAPAAEAVPDPELSDAIILPFAALAYAPVATVSRKSEARDAPAAALQRPAPSDTRMDVAKNEQRPVPAEPRTRGMEHMETRPERDEPPRALRREEAGEAELPRPAASSNAQPPVAVIDRPAGVLPALSPTSLSLVAGLAAQPAPVAPTPVEAGVAAPATSLKIQLHPVELGVITATMRIEDGQIAIEIEVDNPEALSKLASDRDSIERALRSIGLDVGELRIQQAQPSTAQNQAGGQQGGQRDGQGGFAQNQNAAGQSTGQNASGQNGSGGGRPGSGDTIQGEAHAAQRNGAGGAADRGGVFI